MRLDHLLSKEQYTSANVHLRVGVGGVSRVEKACVLLFWVLKDLVEMPLGVFVIVHAVGCLRGHTGDRGLFVGCGWCLVGCCLRTV